MALPANVQNRAEYFYLSPCSKLYLKALLDPFSVEGGQACIPDLNDFPSFKCLVIARGSTTIGTQGLGYIFINPRAATNDTTSAIRYTTAAFASSTVEASTATTGVFTSSIGAMPYTTVQVNAPTGVVARTVGCGLRVRYVGTELNRSGRLIPWRNYAVGQGFNNSQTSQSFLNRPEIPSIANTRKWHAVTYLPTNSLGVASGDAYNYLGASASDNGSGTTALGLDLGWVIDGAVAGSAFEWEAYYHKEYISGGGLLVPPTTTASHSDMSGMSAIRNVLEGDVPVADSHSFYDRALKYIETWSPEDVSHVGETAFQYYRTANKLGFI